MSASGHEPTPPAVQWVVELGTADLDAVEWSTPDVIFHGDVVAHRHGREGWRAVTIRVAEPDQPLVLTRERLGLRVTPTPLPSQHTAHQTWSLDHIVHMWCAGGMDPEAIEEFLLATRGLATDHAIGREAWLEVLAHPTDGAGGESDQPLFDDIFLGRYRDLASLEQLDADPAWAREAARLRRRASVVLDVAIQPRRNQIAGHR